MQKYTLRFGCERARSPVPMNDVATDAGAFRNEHSSLEMQMMVRLIARLNCNIFAPKQGLRGSWQTGGVRK